MLGIGSQHVQLLSCGLTLGVVLKIDVQSSQIAFLPSLCTNSRKNQPLQSRFGDTTSSLSNLPTVFLKLFPLLFVQRRRIFLSAVHTHEQVITDQVSSMEFRPSPVQGFKNNLSIVVFL